MAFRTLYFVALLGTAAALACAEPAYAQNEVEYVYPPDTMMWSSNGPEITSKSTVHEFDIPAGELGPAIRAVVRKAGGSVSIPEQLLLGRRTPGVSGQLRPREALERLLTGTGLTIVYETPRSYAFKFLLDETDESRRLGKPRPAASQQ